MGRCGSVLGGIWDPNFGSRSHGIIFFFSDYEESALDRVLQSAFALSDGAGKITFDWNDMIDYTSEDFYR